MTHRRARGDLPIAAVAYYGPDDRRATKVVASIVTAENDIIAMEKWFSEDEDVRLSPAINQAILDFVAGHDVENVALMERIIGCPHEEGIDYPLGEECPQCPFWHGIDRWTGLPVN